MLNSYGFDLWADDYDRSVELSEQAQCYPFAGYKTVLSRICQEVLTHPDAQVLDLGFGTGVLTTKLYQQGCRIWGQDFSSKMVELARSKMPGAQLYEGDFSHGLVPALEHRCYDYIVSTYALHHLTDDQKIAVLNTLLPLVKNGGKILIGDVAFKDEAAQETCRSLAGYAWDADEHYWVYDQLLPLMPCPSSFEALSPCAGLLTLRPDDKEQFDVVDDDGEPTGDVITRTEAHRLGIRHRTAHVWIIRRHSNQLEILLQKRADHKDSFPGCYDISSAGHIPAGVDYIPSALRELKEELGVTAQPEELIFCGKRKFSFDHVFHGKPFHDQQVTHVYLLWLNRKAEDFAVQKEEISHVKWFGWEDCRRAVAANAIPHCIYSEELDMLAAKLASC